MNTDYGQEALSVTIRAYYLYTEQNIKTLLFLLPFFSLKDPKHFLYTQKNNFSQILFTNLSKSVLVSTSPLHSKAHSK